MIGVVKRYLSSTAIDLRTANCPATLSAGLLVDLYLPLQLAVPATFVDVCRRDSVEPGTVLKGFIADLCDIRDSEAGYVGNGSRASDLARWYYAQVGYAWWPR